MPEVIREYDVKPDTKERLTLRGAVFKCYHVSEYADGQIVLKPRELTVPFQVFANTLTLMDESIQNLQMKKVSDMIDLSVFTE